MSAKARAPLMGKAFPWMADLKGNIISNLGFAGLLDHAKIHFRVWHLDQFTDDFEPSRGGIHFSWEGWTLFQNNVLANVVVPPKEKNVRIDSFKTGSINHGIWRNHLASDSLFHSSKRNTLAAGHICQLNGADPSSNARTFRRFNIEDTFRGKFRAEDRLPWAFSGDGTLRERLHDVLADAPLSILEVMNSIFEQSKTICAESGISGRICGCLDFLENGVVSATVHHRVIRTLERIENARPDG